jgi:Nif-specific regulatory protein
VAAYNDAVKRGTASGQDARKGEVPDAGDALAARLSRAEKERELYLGLLNLNQVEAPMEFVERALSLVVDIVGAQRGYLELMEPEASAQELEAGASAWWTAAGCSEEQVALIRESVSRGIIAHAIAQGQVLSVPSALLDPRFRDRDSVKRSRIESVLCVPIGKEPPLGVIYVQGKSGAGPFSDEDIERAEMFARHLVPLAHEFFQRHKRRFPDATREVRRRLSVETVIGRSPLLAKLFEEIEVVAPVDIGLLISGDTGTGKSQIARVIHDNSRRKNGPFLELNCAALPDSLIESELFGALPGAHSTATRKIAGKVAAAKGGTLFLDEIGELSLTAQAKLLQLLQTKEYYPLGSTRAETADIRVIAATNADLRERIEAQRFREDLFYRLSVLPLWVPSLAERREDIRPLAEHFVEQACARHSRTPLSLSPRTLRDLCDRPWPGNVRELMNAMEAAVLRAYAEASPQIEPTHVFPAADSKRDKSPRGTFHEGTQRFQRELLRQALEDTDWNVAQTARDLDLTRAHVYNLIKSFELVRGKQ